MRFIWFIIVICFVSKGISQNAPLLDSIIQAHPALKNIIDNKNKYKPQIIYTQINRDKDNHPKFKNFNYLVDSSNYFYCASLVKLPCSILALEKINNLNIPGLNKYSPMFTDSAHACQARFAVDTTSENKYPSVAHHIKKMLLVSDNNSYSRIFEFLTPKYIQPRLAELGYPNTRIVHRFDAHCRGEANLYFNQIRFFDKDLKLVYTQKPDSLLERFKNPLGDIFVGRDIKNKKGRVISQKKDFSKSNYMPLTTIHSVLQRLIFQTYLPENKKYNITKDDWQFLVKHLGMMPRETQYPNYNKRIYYDSFKKYFIYGSKVSTINKDTLRIFNIVGQAYGYVVDCAYIINPKTKTEFMLSAVLYCNEKNSFGTGSYEINSVGMPYLKELSLAIYDLERNRKKKHKPDLTEFNFSFGKE
ncbi:MAG: serine hydrolase [Bacteroidota bacterium]|nr:serine hydrolase [Bacteroidota bacterium]